MEYKVCRDASQLTSEKHTGPPEYSLSHHLHCPEMKTLVIIASMGFHATTLAAAPNDVGSAVNKANSNKVCIDLDVEVPVKTEQWLYDQPRVDSDIDAIDWTVNITTWSSKAFRNLTTERIAVDRSFRINARLCAPKSGGAKSDILQIAVPGQAFDKRYVLGLCEMATIGTNLHLP